MGINYDERGNTKQFIYYVLKTHEIHKQLGYTERYAITLLTLVRNIIL